MASNPSDGDLPMNESEERIVAMAKRAVARIDLRRAYFEFAFAPLEAAYKLSEAFFEVEGERVGDVSAFIEDMEARLWGPYFTLIDKIARSMWERAGKPPGMAGDIGMAAQRYFASIMAVATKLSTNPQVLMDQFSAEAYFDKVSDLANAMSRRAGQQAMVPPLAFWLSAENHVVAMLAGVAAAAQSLQDSINCLGEIYHLSNEGYLHDIEEAAYYRWERAGRPDGVALRHWLESEQAMLARIQDGISSLMLVLPEVHQPAKAH